MVEVLTGPAGLIIIGIMFLGVISALVVLSSWRVNQLQLHDLRVEAHRLRLHVKTQSAVRAVAERRRRRSPQSVSVDEPIDPSDIHTDEGGIYVAEAA